VIPRTPEPEVMDSAEEAIAYDLMDHSSVNQCFVEDLLVFVHEQGGDIRASDSSITAVDLGTGTVQIPIRLLHPESGVTWTVLACDLSREMLRIGLSNIQRSGLGQNILPVCSDAKRLPCPDQSVDVVISNSIIHHIPEPLDVFREMRRILKPGGLLFVRDLLRPPDASTVEQIVQKWAADASAHQQAMFRDSLHAALTIEEVRNMLKAVDWNPSAVAQTSDRHWTAAIRASR